MKALLIITLVFILCGCSEKAEEPPLKYRVYEITYEDRIDTVVATRCEYANWTSGGRAIKVFDGTEVIGSYGMKKGQSYTIRVIIIPLLTED